jgi:MoxR-like ATPase
VQAIDLLRDTFTRLKSELGRVIVGQQPVIERLAFCLFARGHALLMGVPGLAKTLLVSKLAETMSLRFNRIQFTPDLMPMDITGTDILQETAGGKREFQFVHGPVFANIVLADEINRAPPKTQAAMLEAMQEHRVTVVGKTFALDQPFLVLATQNPVEQEGTYPLPEAQLDRFMFKVVVDYPSFEEELAIAEQTTSTGTPELTPVLTKADILALQRVVRKVLVGRSVSSFAVRLVRATRPKGGEAPEFVRKYLTWGAGPRACQALLLGAKANALLDGRVHVSLDDIRQVAKPVLRHRLVTSFAAESDGITQDGVIEKLLGVIREEG